MTQNQLRYQELQLKGKELGETQRHNYATEGVESGRLTETSRHNVATEGIDLTKAMEAMRHNQAVEGYESALAGARSELAGAQVLTEHEKARTESAKAKVTEASAKYADIRERANIMETTTKSGKNISDSGVGALLAPSFGKNELKSIDPKASKRILGGLTNG